jgi:DNA-binding CsgD family transcriptional regulator
MGSCKIDRKKNEQEWKNVTLSEIDSIKGLLKYRYRFDIFKTLESATPIDKSSNIESLNEEIFVTYNMIDMVIKKCSFNDKQKQIINLYTQGYTEEDIAQILNDTQQNINGIINSICKKIKTENNDSWYLDNITWNYLIPEFGFKKCSKCGEILPKERRFFSPSNQKIDGFQAYCKKCNTKRMKNE